ncbi:WhiB family transcriptional regulator [Cellulomonas palmilytica]|uniref:WhiB family transcriptional regulator n=1 Tax=Cellulomonas palmilytica TaxID=2608402 RepID=UPI001F3A2E93|nr:WhiB family transcriptional regulator [Cellulomonas palmilytica]UJP39353.1 WhiB family transcriptional regulator [Cellulomonas palmilytica]
MPDGFLFPVLSEPASCVNDPELFFPASTRHVAQVAEAKRVCSGCPAQRDCLAFALTHAVHGIWGGTSEADRRAIQREHGLPVRVAWSGGGPANDTTTTTTTDSTSED